MLTQSTGRHGLARAVPGVMSGGIPFASRERGAPNARRGSVWLATSGRLSVIGAAPNPPVKPVTQGGRYETLGTLC
jgi:hypothetical protein